MSILNIRSGQTGAHGQIFVVSHPQNKYIIINACPLQRADIKHEDKILGGFSMNRFTIFAVAIVFVLLLSMGCTANESNPLNPGTEFSPAPGLQYSDEPGQPSLLGYYDVYVDIEAETIEAVPNRNTEILLNIVRFLNNNPLGIGLGNFVFENQGTSFYIALDWSITHPAPVSPDLDVYDMRAAIIFDESGSMAYNPDLTYGIHGTDQVMLNADGYTRWFNKNEFITPSFQGYVHGNLANDASNCEGTLNPYKYYADGLGATDNAYDYLVTHTAGHGVYTAGATLTRRMEINFPIPSPGFHFGYSIFAVWEDVATVANVPEAIACDVGITPNLYYTGSEGGGDLILDISLFGWASLPSRIYIESTVLDSPYGFTSGQMVPDDSGDYWGMWEIEIPSDHVTSTEGQEMWVIAEYGSYNYVSPFGIPNNAGTDKLAACFRYDLEIADSPTNVPPVIVTGVNGPNEFYPDDVSQYTVYATDADDDPLTYNWIITDNATSTEVYNGPGSGTNVSIDWTTVPATVGKAYTVKCSVSDGVNPIVWGNPKITTCIDFPNQPPVITSGVDGDATPGAAEVLIYTVTASDPESDPLTYVWWVVKKSNLATVLQGPGDGAGGFTVDWSDINGIASGQHYIIFCHVSDPSHAPVYATNLEVVIN